MPLNIDIEYNEINSDLAKENFFLAELNSIKIELEEIYKSHPEESTLIQKS